MFNSLVTRQGTETPADSARTEVHLEQRWVPVTDERGRTRMEACWITVGGTSQAHAA